VTESNTPETPKPVDIKRFSPWWRRLGRTIGQLLRAKVGVLLAIALTVNGCAHGEIGHNIGQVFAGIAEGFLGTGQPPVVAVTPTPTASRPPVVIEPTPTPTLQGATATPTPTPAGSEPSPTPTPVPPVAGCVPKPPASPVTLIYRGGCPRHMEPLAFEGEGNVPPTGACAVRAGEGNGRTSWRLGYGLGRQGMKLENFEGVWLQWDSGRGCTDAYGRHFPDCQTLYQHPEPDAEFSWGGYTRPMFCDQMPTPTVPPTATPTPGQGCAAVEALEHFMAPGNSCHAWHRDGGQIRCLVDSTIRPICDTDHLENWTTFCGGRTHDPDYNNPAEAMVWMIDGAEDRGPSPANSAQRWIVGNPGAQVSVMVCIRPDARTPDRCRITRRGDGCGVRLFRLPEIE
jgi:hypothetical protein